MQLWQGRWTAQDPGHTPRLNLRECWLEKLQPLEGKLPLYQLPSSLPNRELQSHLTKAIAGGSSERLRVMVRSPVPRVKQGQPESRRTQEVHDIKPCCPQRVSFTPSPNNCSNLKATPHSPQMMPRTHLLSKRRSSLTQPALPLVTTCSNQALSLTPNPLYEHLSPTTPAITPNYTMHKAQLKHLTSGSCIMQCF